MSFLDKTGLARLWANILTLVNTKVDRTELKQADWNQTDENQLDYIKNKPEQVSDEEFFNWLVEVKLIEPAASASGEIYTTNNNEIYIL